MKITEGRRMSLGILEGVVKHKPVLLFNIQAKRTHPTCREAISFEKLNFCLGGHPSLKKGGKCFWFFK